MRGEREGPRDERLPFWLDLQKAANRRARMPAGNLMKSKKIRKKSKKIKKKSKKIKKKSKAIRKKSKPNGWSCKKPQTGNSGMPAGNLMMERSLIFLIGASSN